MRSVVNAAYITSAIVHTVNVTMCMRFVGEQMPARSQFDISVNVACIVLAFIAQIVAIIITTKQSTQQYAVAVGLSAVVVLGFAMLMFASTQTAEAYIMPQRTLSFMILIAVISVGSLHWLGQMSAKRNAI